MTVKPELEKILEDMKKEGEEEGENKLAIPMVTWIIKMMNIIEKENLK